MQTGAGTQVPPPSSKRMAAAARSCLLRLERDQPSPLDCPNRAAMSSGEPRRLGVRPVDLGQETLGRAHVDVRHRNLLLRDGLAGADAPDVLSRAHRCKVGSGVPIPGGVELPACGAERRVEPDSTSGCRACAGDSPCMSSTRRSSSERSWELARRNRSLRLVEWVVVAAEPRSVRRAVGRDSPTHMGTCPIAAKVHKVDTHRPPNAS